MGAVLAKNNDLVRRHAVDRSTPTPAAHRAVGLGTGAWPTPTRPSAPSGMPSRPRSARCRSSRELIDEHQGNIGEWAGGFPGEPRPASDHTGVELPATLAALEEVPGCGRRCGASSAGAEIPDHVHERRRAALPPGGRLRRRCGPLHRARPHPYRDGEGILFDDTQPHAAWNHGPRRRVTLFLEVIRPVHGPAHLANAGFQRLLSADPRYRAAGACRRLAGPQRAGAVTDPIGHR